MLLINDKTYRMIIDVLTRQQFVLGHVADERGSGEEVREALLDDVVGQVGVHDDQRIGRVLSKVHEICRSLN